MPAKEDNTISRFYYKSEIGGTIWCDIHVARHLGSENKFMEPLSGFSIVECVE